MTKKIWSPYTIHATRVQGTGNMQKSDERHFLRKGEAEVIVHDIHDMQNDHTG